MVKDNYAIRKYASKQTKVHIKLSIQKLHKPIAAVPIVKIIDFRLARTDRKYNEMSI